MDSQLERLEQTKKEQESTLNELEVKKKEILESDKLVWNKFNDFESKFASELDLKKKNDQLYN